MASLTLVESLATFAALPIIIPVIVGIKRYTSISKAERLIVVLLMFALVSQVVATVLWWNRINNLFISHYFTIVEGYLLMSYFAHYLSSKGSKWITGLKCVFVIFSLSQVFFSFPNLGMNAASKGLESILLIGISLALWRKIMKEYTTENLLSKPVFWINSAVLIYFSASMLLFIFSESILTGKHSARILLWGMHLFFMTIYYVLIGIGLWRITRK
ncbi:MAG: hypothetical protein AB8B56_11585 [Crocinitomicaceae bacterium]